LANIGIVTFWQDRNVSIIVIIVVIADNWRLFITFVLNVNNISSTYHCK